MAARMTDTTKRTVIAASFAVAVITAITIAVVRGGKAKQ